MIDRARYRVRMLRIRWSVCRRDGHTRATRADSRWRHFIACGRCGKFREWIRCDADEGLCGEVATVRAAVSHGLFASARYYCAEHAERARAGGMKIT